jgi:hypothetical protein
MTGTIVFFITVWLSLCVFDIVIIRAIIPT